MEFLKKLFSGKGRELKDETSEAVFMYSQCEKCQEKFRNRIDKQFDLIMNYEDSGPAYRAHKELIGARCRNTIIFDLEFDQQKRLTGKSIQRGQFITREEYEEQTSDNTLE
ncbi:hypothetical protein U27_00658 [Candidatus Vecturithrix granuli]|uniref:Uncharacterized protein n=1 Tax=Vecturithrix granuli TaxID=1499967 RepID=A0A081C855_VECG1|nr:hypothetical protein U27_00658 [Candidatus Vecturithrix granuli]